MLDAFYNAPPTYDRLTAALEWMCGRYGRLKLIPIGKSVLGRDIYALCVGNPIGCTLFVGATHGLEWLTSMLLIRFCDSIMNAMESGGHVSDIDVEKALQKRSAVIIPCLNPDGVEIALRGPEAAGGMEDLVRDICSRAGNPDCREIWQSNARGVDINHNFNAGWEKLRAMEIEHGVCGPSATRYGGPHAHSEPETAAAASFCVTFQPRSLYSFHSQGGEIYYNYGEKTPTHSRMIAQILASSSGYRIARPEGLASHGGLKDWFIEKFSRPGFTIEIGKGKNPLPINSLDKIYARLEEMMMIALLL